MLKNNLNLNVNEIFPFFTFTKKVINFQTTQNNE